MTKEFKVISFWNKPDNLGKVLFVKGANGEGANRGRRGCGAAFGEISGKRVSSFMSLNREPFRCFSELQLESRIPVQIANPSEIGNSKHWFLQTASKRLYTKNIRINGASTIMCIHHIKCSTKNSKTNRNLYIWRNSILTALISWFTQFCQIWIPHENHYLTRAPARISSWNHFIAS